MQRLPSFVIIGAMKSATSTLYEQLRRQPGIFMPSLKEPNFFSDDAQYAKGVGWYSALFDAAAPTDLLGEASTHYAKLPTYPKTVDRLRNCLPSPRLIYVMRHPVDRLISQYVHQISEGEVRAPLDEAVKSHEEFAAYSRYAEQLSPFIEAFGKSAILPVFFDRLLCDPQGELDRISRFIGYEGKAVWIPDQSQANASSERVRKFPLYDLLVEHPTAAALRRHLVPKPVRTRIRTALSARDRPALSDGIQSRLTKEFDDDLATLGRWLGCDLNCRNFRSVTGAQPLNWS
jgi:Sulfotransferase family